VLDQANRSKKYRQRQLRAPLLPSPPSYLFVPAQVLILVSLTRRYSNRKFNSPPLTHHAGPSFACVTVAYGPSHRPCTPSPSPTFRSLVQAHRLTGSSSLAVFELKVPGQTSALNVGTFPSKPTSRTNPPLAGNGRSSRGCRVVLVGLSLGELWALCWGQPRLKHSSNVAVLKGKRIYIS